MDSENRREEELRRETERSRSTSPRIDEVGQRAGDLRVDAQRVGSDEPRAERITEAAARRGTREGVKDREKESGGGLYGSQIDASHILGAVIAEVVGTFILVFGGTAVAVGAILARPTAVAPYDSLTIALAFGLALATVVMAVATDDRAPAAIAPIAVGFALAVGVFIAGPVTGGAVNPVRALGPILVAGDLTSAWLYILGPIVGGVLAALLYQRFLAQTEAPA